MTESGTPGDPGTPPASGWQAPAAQETATVAGAPGFVYADVPNRVIALIVDYLIIGAVNLILLAIVTGIFGLGWLLFLVVALGRPGDQRGLPHLHLDLDARDDRDEGSSGCRSATPVDGQTSRRAGDAALAGPVRHRGSSPRSSRTRSAASCRRSSDSRRSPGSSSCCRRRRESPTKQGWHDVFANTMVVKAARDRRGDPGRSGVRRPARPTRPRR